MANFNWYWMFLFISTILWQPSQTIAPDRWDNTIKIPVYDQATLHKTARKYLTGGEPALNLNNVCISELVPFLKVW